MKVTRADDSIFVQGASYLDDWSDEDWDRFLNNEKHPESKDAFKNKNQDVQHVLVQQTNQPPGSPWHQVDWHDNTRDCDHQQSMCPDCAEHWFNDHDIDGLPRRIERQFYD